MYLSAAERPSAAADLNRSPAQWEEGRSPSTTAPNSLCPLQKRGIDNAIARMAAHPTLTDSQPSRTIASTFRKMHFLEQTAPYCMVGMAG